MSLDDYYSGLAINSRSFTFNGIVQAAMRKADTDNLQKLKDAWPEIYTELQARHNAPGGMLPDEIEPEEAKDA